VFARADDMPTVQQMEQLQADKNWPEVLKATTRVLGLRGEAAAGYDRVAMWMLKAEAQLQSSQFVPAATSFEAASSEPTAKPEQADFGKGMARVARKSDRRGFRIEANEVNKAGQNFDILDPAQRKPAMAALLTQSLDALDLRLIKFAKALPPTQMMTWLKDVQALAPLERAATGEQKQTLEREQALADTFTKKTTARATTSKDRITQIEAEARKFIQTTETAPDGRVTVHRQQRGLSTADKKELKQVITDSEKLAGVFQALSEKIEPTVRESLASIKVPVQTVNDDARRLLTTTFEMERIR